MDKEKAVIIIPTYNEAAIIEETIEKVFQEVSAISNLDVHLLIFDSNSNDGTQDILYQLQKKYSKLHVKTEESKSGLGSAYFQAMTHALNELHADIIVEFDADLSHQPIYLPPMFEALQNYDVVIGSRYIVGGSIAKNWCWNRKILSILGNQIARLILTRKYKDFTSGFRVTRKNALLKALPSSFISPNYAYKIELLWLLHKNKLAILEYPIHFIDRQKGKSKLPAHSIFDSIRVLWNLRFNELKRYIPKILRNASVSQ
ncbi:MULTISPECIES: polyprenol monophosphomannose synthase [Legionella]|uniref:Glycosyltransferase n=1 Tax=Legionella maceachernii TaxID=466 RepID=A0A0W0VYP7_9GAMM|nr:polyprenol monophosphomannose synthase [Legionella maceachernii]KTD25178.1 glycosyltransferase [Legionella maceachernii]SJZ75672.1 Glycosyltransferase involved in cell wall bisynthesis [Legionella maceachernii]SUP03175.1 Undecaprenyl-phosphate 4-deoxy-4-formamido-L-arabinose transferase [Legionella maceachernii]